jgi:hypothetical protein
VAYARVLAPARRALVVTVAVLFAVAGLGTHADAAPSPADIEAQINQQWATLEPLVEQYNMVHSELQQNQAKSDALATQMRPLQLRVDLIMNRVGTMSASLYEHGQLATVSAMLSGSPGTLADRMTTLNVLAQRQTDTVRDAATLISQYETQKKPLDTLIATEGTLDADLAAKKTTIETQMAAPQTCGSRHTAHPATHAMRSGRSYVRSCSVPAKTLSPPKPPEPIGKPTCGPRPAPGRSTAPG